MGLVRHLRSMGPSDYKGESLTNFGMAAPPEGPAWTFSMDAWPHLGAERVHMVVTAPTLGSLLHAGWRGAILGVRPTGGAAVLPEEALAGCSYPMGPRHPWARGAAEAAAEWAACAALHSVVESVTYQQFVIGSDGEFEEGDSGYELEAAAVSPTRVHEAADQFGTFEAEDDDVFRSEPEEIGRGGEEQVNYLSVRDLDGRSLATFSDWGSRPYPLLYDHSFPAALQIMASRGFYLFSFWEEAQETRELVETSGFGHLVSPIQEFGRLVLESRDPRELLVLQDLLLGSDLEGSEHTFLPTDRQGAPIELPFDVVEAQTDYGFPVQLLRQSTASVKGQLLR